MMKIHLQLDNTTLLALLNFGSTHNFILEAAANSTTLLIQSHASMKVTMGNGKHVPFLSVLCQGTFTVDDEAFHMDLFV